MLHTSICDLLGINIPIIQAGMGPFTSAELASAVSNAGALGSLGAGARPLEDLITELAKLQGLTAHPFAVNFTLSPALPNPEAFDLALKARPKLISFALGDPGGYIGLVHDAGILVMHQVTNVQQAYQAAEAGVDLIIAQGAEAGGFGGTISSLALIPQVVDEVSPVPVIAAGGIADGRGMAAALMLGAVGVNMGTRFLASHEAPISMEWKRALLEAESNEAIKVEFWNEIFPLSSGAYLVSPRSLSSPFIHEWQSQPGLIKQQASQLQGEIGAAIEQGRLGELFPFTGESVGLINDIPSAAEIVLRLVTEAEAAIKHILQPAR